MFPFMSMCVEQTQVLTRPELARVLQDGRRPALSANARRNHVIVRLACCCGLRASEVAAFRLGDMVVGVSRAYAGADTHPVVKTGYFGSAFSSSERTMNSRKPNGRVALCYFSNRRRTYNSRFVPYSTLKPVGRSLKGGWMGRQILNSSPTNSKIPITTCP